MKHGRYILEYVTDDGKTKFREQCLTRGGLRRRVRREVIDGDRLPSAAWKWNGDQWKKITLAKLAAEFN